MGYRIRLRVGRWLVGLGFLIAPDAYAESFWGVVSGQRDHPDKAGQE